MVGLGGYGVKRSQSRSNRIAGADAHAVRALQSFHLTVRVSYARARSQRVMRAYDQGCRNAISSTAQALIVNTLRTSMCWLGTGLQMPSCLAMRALKMDLPKVLTALRRVARGWTGMRWRYAVA